MISEDILGFAVNCQSVDACIDSILNHICLETSVSSAPKWLACLNPHSYAVSKEDDIFERSLKSADWLIPDGIGIVLASRFGKKAIRNRITGADIFFGLHRRINEETPLKVFFLGSTENTLAAIEKKMGSDYPRIKVVGTYSPPFKPVFSEEDVGVMIDRINSSHADVLWVGMTAPKQEKWIFENINRLNVRFVGAVGAVFDFYIGNVKRSHPFFQRCGLEWLPRLMQQPRRLWRRTFVSAPVFIFDLLCSKFIKLK